MGLFSSKKKVYVSSTIYNMTEDDTDKPRATFMQESILNSVLSKGGGDLARDIISSHTDGPRSGQRSFFRWAKNNFDFAMPRAAINYLDVVDAEALAEAIIEDVYDGSSDIEITINNSFIDNSDESYYAERHLYMTKPALVDTQWAADYNSDSKTIGIQFAPGTEFPAGTPIITENFSVEGFNTSDDIIVAYYTAQNTSTGDTQESSLYIYKIGSGIDELDVFKLQAPASSDREFYPFIPLRIDNLNPFENGSPASAKQEIISEAFDKSLGGDINDLITEIENNENIADIDYAYIVFGIPLNTKSKFGKNYLFEFFRSLSTAYGSGVEDFNSYESFNDLNGYQPRLDSFGNETLNTTGSFESATVTRSPAITNLSLTLPTGELGVLDMRISWSSIKETRFTGLINPTAKSGDVDVSSGGSIVETTLLFAFLGGRSIESSVDTILIRKQINSQEYIELACTGLAHKNLIYDGKSVDITALEAINDPDDSGFILPLHEPTLKKLGIINSTEVARDSYYIVFNSFEVVKVKFFQRGIFKIFTLIVLAAIVIAFVAFTGGSGLAGLGGLSSIAGLGASVSTALGLTGLLGLAITSAVNAIAAIIITQAIGAIAPAILGEKLGQIFTSVVSTLLTISSGGVGLASFASNTATLATAGNLLALTNSAVSIASTIQGDKLKGTAEDLEDLTNAHNSELERLKSEFESLGFGDNVIDPIMLTDFSGLFADTFGSKENLAPGAIETLDGFINRTLMTGTDVAELSLAMIDNFAEGTLTLKQ